MRGGPLPTGLHLDDVQPLYYSTARKAWTQIEKIGALSERALLGATTHFTDFMAATMPAPNAPGQKSFVAPNAMETNAEPMAMVPMIAPPAASSIGGANLQHPIVLPPGRAGMAPGLAFQYQSGGANGWLGVGWSVPMSTIEIDTRFGVPRYEEESEHRYVLDGQALVEADAEILEARPWLAPGDDETIFVRRAGPPSEMIVRIGESAPYQWELRFKDGRVRRYGGTANAQLADPHEPVVSVEQRTKIFRWYVREDEDAYGNRVEYTYTHEEGCLDDVRTAQDPVHCDENFVSVYPEQIEYTKNDRTGNDGKGWGYYRVRFETMSELRSDMVISARPGFVEAKRRLLKSVIVDGFTSRPMHEEADAGRAAGNWTHHPIRRYLLTYRRGDFDRSLLASIRLQSVLDYHRSEDNFSDDTYFVKHEFSYASNEDDSGDSTAYTIFDAAQVKDHVTWDEVDHTFALSRQESATNGASVTGGYNFFGIAEATVSAGGNWGRSQINQSFQDLNGDGLPDFFDDHLNVHRHRLDALKDRRADYFGGLNLDALRQGTFDRASADNLTKGRLGQTVRRGVSVSGQANVGKKGGVGLGASSGFSKTWNNERQAMVDLNGDGFVDLVHVADGAVKVRLGDGQGGFADEAINWGVFSKDEVPSTDGVEEEGEERPRHFVDPILRFFAPYPGQIKIDAPLTKVAAGGDGVWAAIYQRSAGNPVVCGHRR